MLNKIKLILWLIILLAVAYFVSMNVQPTISVNILPDIKTPELPLALIIIISMIIGAILILIFTITDWFAFKIEKLKLKRQLNLTKDDLEKCKKENKKLKEEIENFKNQLEVEKNKKSIKVEEEKEKKDGAL